jgi:protein-S-isoprenylcysteine O-methyltransferase Ste14
LTAGVIAPPPLLYAVPLVAGLLFQRWHPIRILTPSIATIVGIVCVALGFVGLPAVVAFRRANTSPKPWVPSTALVTTGPYRFTRNPMYLGFTLLYLGVAFWTNAVWPLLFLPIVLVVMHYGVVMREEAYMALTFGEQYQRYREQVRRWL